MVTRGTCSVIGSDQGGEESFTLKSIIQRVESFALEVTMRSPSLITVRMISPVAAASTPRSTSPNLAHVRVAPAWTVRSRRIGPFAFLRLFTMTLRALLIVYPAGGVLEDSGNALLILSDWFISFELHLRFGTFPSLSRNERGWYHYVALFWSVQIETTNWLNDVD